MELLCLQLKPLAPATNAPALSTLATFPIQELPQRSSSHASSVVKALKLQRPAGPWPEPILISPEGLSIVVCDVTPTHALVLVCCSEHHVRLELLHMVDSLIVGLQATWPVGLLTTYLDKPEEVVKAAVYANMAKRLELPVDLVRMSQLFLRGVPHVDISEENMELAFRFEEALDMLEARYERSIETLNESDLALPVGIAAFALPGVCFHTSLPMMLLYPLFCALNLWNVWNKAVEEDTCFSCVKHFFAEIPRLDGDVKNEKRHLVVAIAAYGGLVTCRVMCPQFSSDPAKPPQTFGHIDPFGAVEAKRLLLEFKNDGISDRVRSYIGATEQLSRLCYEEDGSLWMRFQKDSYSKRTQMVTGRPRSRSDVQFSAARRRRSTSLGIKASLMPKARARRRLSFAGSEGTALFGETSENMPQNKQEAEIPPTLRKLAKYLDNLNPKMAYEEIVTVNAPQEIEAPLSLASTLARTGMTVQALEEFERSGKLPAAPAKTKLEEEHKLVTQERLYTRTWAGPIDIEMANI